MKKALSIVLVSLMILASVSLAACGNKGTEPASSEPASGKTSEQVTEAEEISTNELKLTTIDGTDWKISYPATFVYEETTAFEGGMGQKNETKRGIIEGEFSVYISDGEIYPNAYENVAAMNAQFKSADIYEERTVGGKPAYISQRSDAKMKVVIGYTDTNYICLNFVSESGDYQTLYNSDSFNSIVNSITFLEAAEKAPVASQNGYLTVTPVGAWIEGESKQNNAPTLYNASISSVSWAIFDDSQLSSVDDLKGYILTGYADYSFESKTIGANQYEVLDAGSVVFLVAPTSTGKGVEIELRNVTLDQAQELLETVVIK